MSEIEKSPEFFAQYRERYGYGFSPVRPDYSRCAESVAGRGRGDRPHQCNRKNGHGPHGAWCGLHDPDAVAARTAAKRSKWKAEWKRSALKAQLETERLKIIKEIAEGHNDPRSLCQDYLDRLAAFHGSSLSPYRNEGK